jgi:hypothetical protein
LANGSFAGSVQLNISNFLDGTPISGAGFFDMRAEGEMVYLATANPVGSFKMFAHNQFFQRANVHQQGSSRGTRPREMFRRLNLDKLSFIQSL